MRADVTIDVPAQFKVDNIDNTSVRITTDDSIHYFALADIKGVSVFSDKAAGKIQLICAVNVAGVMYAFVHSMPDGDGVSPFVKNGFNLLVTIRFNTKK